MNHETTDVLLGKMSRAGRLGLLAWVAVLAVAVAGSVPPEIWMVLACAAGMAAAAVALVATVATAYYVLQIGRREQSLSYAIAHALLCLVLFLGILLVPFLVGRDIERWRETERRP